MRPKLSISMQIYDLRGNIAMAQAGGMKCWMLNVNLWEMKSFAFVRFRCSSFAFEASDFALRATTGQVGGQAVVSPTAGQKKADMMKKETFSFVSSVFGLWERFASSELVEGLTAITRVIVAASHSHQPLITT